MKCDNTQICHSPEVINEDNNAILVYCSQCGQQERIGKDIKGNPEHRLFSEWFKKDTLQPDYPLYYKYAGAKGMRVI